MGLPLAGRPALLLALVTYSYLSIAAVRHCFSLFRLGDHAAMETGGLATDVVVLMLEYVWETVLATVYGRTVLQHGQKTWARHDVLQHHLATCVAFSAGLVHAACEGSMRLIGVYRDAFTAILCTSLNELLFVVPALGGEVAACRALGLPCGHFPIETFRVFMAFSIVANLSISEMHAVFVAWRAHRSNGDLGAAMYGPFFLVALLGYHLPLARLNFRNVLRVRRKGWCRTAA
mmetsp:Transcript_109192/g.307921  ORF Transcript_109192/g.307921 Transcript_109192/m.307921 type:complete len:233 (+) Transcript_109192:129-827(+)